MKQFHWRVCLHKWSVTDTTSRAGEAVRKRSGKEEVPAVEATDFFNILVSSYSYIDHV